MTQTALGRCAKNFLEAGYPFDLSVAADNREPLACIYNRAIDASDVEDEILIFLHDDVYITDLNWPEKLSAAVGVFDIVGIVGSKISNETTPIDATQRDYGIVVKDSQQFSGRIASGVTLGHEKITVFGDAPAACSLLDGVFLASTRRVLLKSGLRFDERFQFHFYDVDFCRQARMRQLTLGTWPISLLHGGVGNFDSPEWHRQHEIYLSKYGES